MPTDANMVIEVSTARVATGSTAAKTIGNTPRRGLKAHVAYSVASTASGSATVTPTVEASYDGGGTWFLAASGAANVIPLQVAGNAGEVFVPFEVSQINTNLVQVRVVYTFANTSSQSTPTVTTVTDVMLGRPS